MGSKINVAVVGLRFGAEFIPIYQHHPDVASLTICDTDDATLARWGDTYQVERRARTLDDLLTSAEVDAVHLVTPVNIHAEQSVAVLDAGKHCACTIPMGLTIDELNAVTCAGSTTIRFRSKRPSSGSRTRTSPPR